MFTFKDTKTVKHQGCKAFLLKLHDGIKLNPLEPLLELILKLYY